MKFITLIFKTNLHSPHCFHNTSHINFTPFPPSNQIILHSMHKYQPRVHVVRKDFSSELSPNKPVPSGEGVKTFSFPETVFTTVTAYQNQQVGSLSTPEPGHLVSSVRMDGVTAAG